MKIYYCSSFRSLLLSLLFAAALILIIAPPGSVHVVAAQNTTTTTTTGGGGDVTDADFVMIEDEIPQNVDEVRFPPEYNNPCRSVPKTKFTLRTSDSVEVLSYPADIVTVSQNGSILLIDFAKGLSVVDNTTYTGIIIAFPADQLKKVGKVEREQRVHIEDGFTSLTSLSEVNTGAVLTATFTQLLQTTGDAGDVRITGLSATTKGKAIIVTSSNVGFDSISASTAGAVLVVGNVMTSARASTGGVVVIEGTLYGNGTSSTGASLMVGQVGGGSGQAAAAAAAKVTYNTGGQVETPNCTFVSSSDDDTTGGECTEGNIKLPFNASIQEAVVAQGYIPCCNWWDVDCILAPFVSSHAAAVASPTTTSAMVMIIMSLLCL